MKQNTLTDEQQQLVLDNMEFAQKLACGFTRNKTILPDLQQESLYGLCQAALRFQPNRGVEFTTFAYLWCRKYIILGTHKFGYPMVIPVDARDEVELLELDLTFGDLDDGDDDGSMMDRLLFKVAEPEPELECDKHYEEEKLSNALRKLTKQEYNAICHLFGLEGMKEHKIAHTAHMLGISAARVRELKQKALRKLEGSLT